MKKNQLAFILALLLPLSSMSQEGVGFDRYFTNQTLRIDYYRTGNAVEEFFSLDQIYLQGTWAGNPDQCIQPFDLGLYGVKVYDLASNKLIFSADYNTIFGEYQTTGEAKKGKMRTYHESVLIPRPKHLCLFVIEKRDKNNLLRPVFNIRIDPGDYHLVSESCQRTGDMILPVKQSGDPHHKVDLVIVGEGYTLAEQDKFKKDLEYYTGLFFTVEPYKSHQKDFNITGIFTPSDESGVNEPRQGVYRKTAL
ncbi:MAG TPA: peptidase M64 N-terminal domain-containing protein, partial [bacterium]